MDNGLSDLLEGTIGNNSEDEFQQSTNIYAARLNHAIANINMLRNYTRPAGRPKKKQKPGPKAISVRLRFYLLPEGSDLPKFSKKDSLIERHQGIGYGFPSMYYKEYKGKHHPVPLDITEEEFREMIRSLYPKLYNKRFSLFTQNQRRKLTGAPFSPRFFKELHYQGVVIIKIEDTDTLPPNNIIDLSIQQDQRTERDTAIVLPASSDHFVPTVQQNQRTEGNADIPLPDLPSLLIPTLQQNQRTDTDTAIVLPASSNQNADIPLPDLPYLLIPTIQQIQRTETDIIPHVSNNNMNPSTQQNQRTEQNVAVPSTSLAVPSLQFTNSPASPPEQNWVRSGTPEVTFNPRQFLVNQQDLDFADALAADREQEESRQTARIRRTLERQERRRRRDRFKGDLEQGMQASSSEEESCEQEEPEQINFLKVHDITELESRRLRIHEVLLPAVDITVRRNNIVNDVIDAYKEKPDLVHHHLTVSFEKEEAAVDLDGVTREMFSCFFLSVIAKFFSGRFHKVPRVDSRTLFNGTFQTIGRIISHAFVLCKYLPPTISPIVYILAGSGFCSDKLFVESFMLFMTESDQKLVEHLMENSNWDGLTAELINFVSSYGGFETPVQGNFKQILLDLARMTLTVVPCVPISKLKSGMECYNLLWEGITEDVVKKMLEQHKPSPSKVLSLIEFNSSSESTVLIALEERVKNYFEQYIRSLTDSELITLLKFWTSCDIICLPKLYVEFNSCQGIDRRPTVNTCTATLQISRFYFSAQELIEDFHLHLNHSSSRMFDSI